MEPNEAREVKCRFALYWMDDGVDTEVEIDQYGRATLTHGSQTVEMEWDDAVLLSELCKKQRIEYLMQETRS